MAFITVYVTNLKETTAGLNALAAGLSDMTGAMEAVGAAVAKYFAGPVFLSQGAVIGQRWAALNPETQAYKSKHWPGRSTLVRTGAMQEGFTYDAGPMEVMIYNQEDYFKYHQLGTSDGSGRGHNIPARPMIAVNEPIVSTISKIIQADVEAKIGAHLG